MPAGQAAQRGRRAARPSCSAAVVREALPGLAGSAAAVGRLTYTGPPFVTEADQIHGLVDVVENSGATFHLGSAPSFDQQLADYAARHGLGAPTSLAW